MQTIEVIQTVQWIQAEYSEETKHDLFGGGLFPQLGVTEGDVQSSEQVTKCLTATHEVSAVRRRLNQHQFARIVLAAVGLEDLLA